VLNPEYNDMLFQLAEADGVDPGALGLAALCAVSGAAHKASRFYPYGKHLRFRVPPIIWGMPIAPSGQRKSACNSPFAALQHMQAKVWAEYGLKLKAWKALDPQTRKNQPEPEQPRSYLSNDGTVEKVMRILAENPRGLLVLRDELSAFFGFGRYNKDKGAGERAFYLESYEGGPYTVHRVTSRSFHIQVNAISVFGFIQPERLASFKDLDSDGLLQRFFLLLARPARVSRDIGPIPGKDKFDIAIKKVTEMPQLDFTTNAEGTAIIREMESDAVAFCTYSDLGAAFQGFCGKLHGSLARLALVLHLLEELAKDAWTLVQPETIARADKLVRNFIIPHAHAAHASLVPDKVERTKDIAAWLLTKAPVSIRASDIVANVRSCRGLTDPAELNKALEPLTTGGWLEPEIPFPTNRKWTLHLQVREALAHRVAQAVERREQMRQLWERIGAEKQR
jgi:hypothetical protein